MRRDDRPRDDGLRDDGLERWLRAHAEAIFDDAPDGAHLSDERLAAAPGLDALTVDERAHLLRCAECREIWRVALEATTAPAGRAFGWRPWVLAGAALAAGIGALWVVNHQRVDPAQESAPAFVARGVGGALEAPALSLRAVSVDGQVRDLQDGGTVHMTERLGFVYGNADGSAQTLTVLGYDGRRLHWYYPASPGASGQVIARGADSRGVRLPFDVALAADHRPGTLHIAWAFDADAAALGARLQSGAALGESVTVIRVQVAP